MANPPPTFARVENEEALLRTAAALSFLRAEQAMRVGEEGRYSLFFPSQVRREEQETDEEQEEVTFHFGGSLENVYASLVVRIARGGFFLPHSTLRRRAIFAGPSGEFCSLTLRASQTGGEMLVLGYERQTGEWSRLLLEEYVNSQLQSWRERAVDFQRERRFYCPSCGHAQSDDDVRRRREQGQTAMKCVNCARTVSLLERAEAADGSHHAAIAEMNRVADARRALDVAALTLHGKTLAKDFDVFLSYAMNDKARVDELDARLREQGILSWRPTEQIYAGDYIVSAVREGVEKSKAFVVVVGESELSPWQVNEMSAAVSTEAGTLKRRAAVLIGRAEKALALPEFLPTFPVIDMREFTPAAMEQLVEVITGESGKYIDPNTARLDLSSQSQQRTVEETKNEEREQQPTHAGVLRFDRDAFFNSYVEAMSKLSQSQVAGLDQLLGFIEQDEKVDDVRAAAFILALVKYETADTWQPLWDNSGAAYSRYEPGTALGRSLGNTQSGDGKRFRGRGYILVTGRANYQKLSDALGIDLVANPDAAIEPATAYRMLSESLFSGLLTGKKIGDFLTSKQIDYGRMLTTVAVEKSGPKTSRIVRMARTFVKILRESFNASHSAHDLSRKNFDVSSWKPSGSRRTTSRSSSSHASQTMKSKSSKSPRSSKSMKSSKSLKSSKPSRKPSAKRPQPKKK